MSEIATDVFELNGQVDPELEDVLGIELGNDEAAKTDKGLWMIGIGLEMCAALTGTIGKQLLRKSAMVKADGHLRKAKFILIGGLALETCVGPVIDMAAYAFAPQMLIAPFQATQLLFNTLLAPCNLGEKLGRRHIIACITIAVAMVLVAGFGVHDEPEYTFEIIYALLVRSVRAAAAWPRAPREGGTR